MNDARPMRATRAALALLALAALPAAALAAPTCFTVYNRAGEIIYRDTVSPFEGALDPTSTGREAMRVRGEHLVFFEAEFCPQMSRVVGLGSLQGRAPTTDEIVATFPTMGYGNVARPAGTVPATMAPSAAPGGGGGPAVRMTEPATNAVQMRTGSYR